MPKILFKRLKVDEQRKITAGSNQMPESTTEALPPEPTPEDCLSHGTTITLDCIEQAIGEPNNGGDG